MPSLIMKHFDDKHLPDHLKVVSQPISELAQKMNDCLPYSTEKTVGLRRLLEAKYALVCVRLG